MWRLMPSIFFAQSKPRGPTAGLALTLEESTTAAVGAAFLLFAARIGSRSSWSAISNTGEACPTQEPFVDRGPVHFVVVGQVAPRAAGAQHVEDRVEILARPHRIDPATDRGLGQQYWGDNCPLLIGQVGWVRRAGKRIHTCSG